IFNTSAVTTANAGTDQAECDRKTPFQLAANQPVSTGNIPQTGKWTVIYTGTNTAPAPTPADAHDATVTVAPGDSVRLVWTISSGDCAVSTDTVNIYNYSAVTTANAGIDQKECNKTTPFQLAANQPVSTGNIPQTGKWTVIYNGTNTTPAPTPADAYNAAVTVAPGDSVRLVWTISSGNCAVSTDTVAIYNYSQASKAYAGLDREACQKKDTFQLNATIPLSTGNIPQTGKWTVIYNGSNTVPAPMPDTAHNAGVYVQPGDSAILVWTVYSGNCATTSDSMVIKNYTAAANAVAGNDLKECERTTAFMLNATPLPSTGTIPQVGTWSVVSFTTQTGNTIPSIINPHSPNAEINVLPGDSVVLKWKVEGGMCASDSAQMSVVNYKKASASNAGIDTKVCSTSNDFIMSANQPDVTTAFGTWTVVYGNAIVRQPNSNVSPVYVPVGDSSVLRWTIHNGTCDSTTSLVTLVNYKGASNAVAGTNQEKCNSNDDFVMAANQPDVSSAFGTWTVVSGNAVIHSPNAYNTTVTVLPGNSAVLQWTIHNGNCASTSSTVNLINYASADKADAGPDQTACNQTAPFTLAANKPSVSTATGMWTIVKGIASIDDKTVYNTTVTVQPGDTIILRWTISNGNCTSTEDEMTIINYKKPVDAVAGPNQEHCDDANFQMHASDPGVAGAIGTWIVTGGDKTKVSISNENDKDAIITVQAGETVQMTWVVSNGVCNASSSSVTLINRKPILNNTISSDQTLCKTEAAAALTGNILTGGNGTYTYQWQSSTSGPAGPFTNIGGATNDTYQPGIIAANTWYRRLVTSGACINNISNVVSLVVVTQNPVVTTTPPSFTTECVLNKDYTTMFGTPVFSHAPYTNEQLTVTFSDVTTIVNACTKTITRTWVAIDRCGLSVKTSQTITVVDTKAPVFKTSAPADVTVECDKVPAKVNLIAKDDCGGDITIVPVEVRKNIPGNCANNYLLIRTWTARDACNTGVTLTQTITVQDKTAPVFTMPTPANITVDCDKVPAGTPLTASDNCSVGVITVMPKDSTVQKPGDCQSKYTIYRKWTAVDECGNAASVQQIISVQDTTRPVFSMPAPKDTVVDCDKVPGWPVISAADNCTGNVQVITNSKIVKLPGSCSGTYIEVRTWTATDACNNIASMQQMITVQDTIKPVFTIMPPADTTVSCDAIPAPDPNVTATDNCSSGASLKVTRTITTEKVPGACGNTYRIIRTWTAIDACTNKTEVRQVITVVDTTRPVVIGQPADITIYCQDKIPAPVSLIATDNCDPSFPKKATYSEDPYVKDICNGYTITRRWTITDACGNKANDVIQHVIIKPCDKPQLSPNVPTNCSDNPRIVLTSVGNVTRPTYTLVAVTPSNAVTGLPITQASNIFNLNGATSASFIITDGNTGCSSDTVTYALKYIQKPVVNLGKDTTICGGNSLVLDAGAANFGYTIKWSTGETTQRINVTKAGTYWVNVSNGQCATTDTIKVGLIPTPLVDIPDTTICRGQSVKLDAYVNGASYLWSNGSTASSILVSTQEDFWVKVSKSGCITIDTVKVSVNPPPDISLSRDTTICPDQSIMLTVNTNGGRIQWQTGETSNSIIVSKPGGYWVAVSRDNCVVRDTVNVRLKPEIKVDLGPDRNICPGSSITLDGTTANAISYLWNDGDPNPVKAITEAGKYKIAVMDKFCQRVYMDSVKVAVTGLPKVNLGNDTVMCKGETLTLRAQGSGITAVRWDNGSTAPSLNVTESGNYTVTVFNDCGSATDNITVNFTECEPKPQFPNAFSPNGDGRNDVFRPVVRGPMYEYELRIFNRWGELIFLSSDQHRGWDGKYKGTPVDVGTYVWWLTYKKSANGTANVLKGEVTVIR
ncbi:gliding motility-associated C-terminal domain-containing protein, partial [Chitinophaga sp. Hz27]|uniref:HYR-like domain-containing protein n=1 Tax=Chitinophaga sp. Hz27 TaxID=3347169 RepID=UPI0035D7CDBD